MKDCPVCKNKVAGQKENKSYPFCSERCRLIDLGDWLSENHKIPLQGSEELIDGPDDDELTRH